MKSILRIVKLMGVVMLITSLIALFFEPITGEEWLLYPSFGSSIFIDGCILTITFTRGGKRYFSWLFQLMIIFLMAMAIAEQINVYIPLDVFGANLALSFTGLAITSYIASIIWYGKKKNKRNRRIKK